MARLPNHLRKHRKRTALSQDELACLLGVESGAKLSRYECFARLPNLLTALALEIVFRCPVAELFPGLVAKLEKEIRERATELLEEDLPGDAHQVRRKREAIEKILGVRGNDNQPHK